MRDVRGEDVTATVLSYNSWGTLSDVLKCLREQTLQPGRVIVVDNASPDGTADHLREIERVDVIALDQNLGVGHGHNRGIQAAMSDPGCKYVWILEHDSMPTPTCLEELMRAESILSREGRTIGALLPRRVRKTELSPGPVFPEPHDRTILTFNGTLVPRNVVALAGLLREDFFVGLEDSEFSDRLHRMEFEILVVPSSLLFHETIGMKRRGVRLDVLRAYYSTRNSVFLEVHLRQNLIGALAAPARALAGSLRSLLMEDMKLRRICGRMVATFDGLTRRMGKRSYWFLSGSAR